MYQLDNTVVYRNPDHQSLEQLLLTTEQMVASAEACDWDAVDALRVQRSQELETYIDHNPNWQALRHDGSKLATLLVLNDRLVNRVAQGRQEVHRQFQSLQAGKSASSEYDRVQASNWDSKATGLNRN